MLLLAVGGRMPYEGGDFGNVSPKEAGRGTSIVVPLIIEANACLQWQFRNPFCCDKEFMQHYDSEIIPEVRS